LRKHSASLPTVQILFEHEFLSAGHSENGVHCLVRDRNADCDLNIECSYLVGADGPRSSIRDLIGARMEGRYGLLFSYNIIFRAPGLAEMHKHGPGIMYFQINSDLPSLIGPMDKDDLWYFMPVKVPGLERLDNASAAALISRATGIDLPYEVLSADEWAASEFIADKYRDRRIFLIGDACHLHPPTGGYGMNMGIADSVDLGWKLAAVLQGWGGEALLDSYEQERRPVHRRVMDAAMSNLATLGLDQATPHTLEADTEEGAALRMKTGAALAERRLQEFRSLGVMLGYTYDASPIIADEEGPREIPDPSMRTYVPTARPGARAPHAWLTDDRSLYDVFGEGFTLLAFEAVAAELERAQADARLLGIPLKVVPINDKRIASLYECRLALIRPDQHVAWRGDTWPGPEILRRASGRNEAAQALEAPHIIAAPH
jgi:2-polyprenyl-6-methoxyphenol hydroxylase-like FAD-dependent oxidoreductase